MIKRVAEREIFKTKFFTIKDLDLDINGKKKVTFQILEKGDTAMIVPITDDKKVILVREYFAAIDEYQLSLPKGRIVEGHDALKTANNEIQEEIGYKASKFDFIGTLTMSPGYLSQKTHIYLALGLVESKLAGDEMEDLEVVFCDFDKFEDLIEKRELTEARTIAALYLVKRKLS